MPVRAFIARALLDVSASVLATVGGGGTIAAASLLDGRLDVITVIALFMMIVGLNEWSVRRGFRAHEDNEQRVQRALLAEATSSFTRDVGALRQEWERQVMVAEGQAALAEAAVDESRKFRETVAATVREHTEEIGRIKERLNVISRL